MPATKRPANSVIKNYVLPDNYIYISHLDDIGGEEMKF